MCISLQLENLYGFCFDKFRTDLCQGWERTIQAYLLDNGIVVNNEEDFGRAFLNFLEEMHNKNLIRPLD